MDTTTRPNRQIIYAHCPDERLRAEDFTPVEVYFDNVGGPLLERVLRLLKLGGRVVCCGAVSMYDTGNPTAAEGARASRVSSSPNGCG
jgi:NADPH-dependent curcumin reductase CurA